MFYTKKNKFYYLLIFFLLSIQFSFAYRENNYTYVINGAKTTALGGNIAATFESRDFIFQSPALLGSLEKNFFFYEFATDLRYQGFRSDYRFNFDSLSSLAAVFSFNQSAIPYLAVVYQTLFQSIEDNPNNTDSLEMKQFGLSSSYSFSKSSAIGFNVGSLLAFESNEFTIAPSFQISYKIKVSPVFFVGFSFLSPHYLNWGLFSGSKITEWTPSITRIGSLWKLNPTLSLYSEIKHQGWDFISYQNNNQQEIIDRGNSFFDLHQDIFYSFGIHYKNRPFSLSKKEKKIIYEEIKTLTKTINDLQEVPSYEKEKKKLLKRVHQTSKENYNLKYKTLSPVQKQELKQIYLEKKEKINKLKLLEKRKEKQYLFVKQTNQTSEKKQLLADIKSLGQREKKLKYHKMTPAHQTQYQNNLLLIKQLKSNYRLLIKTKKESKQSKKNTLTLIEKKIKAKQELSQEEEIFFKKESTINLNKKTIKRLRAKLNKKTLLPFKGDYYLGFYPEAIYSSLSREVLKMGNITMGFSFKPFNIDRLTAHLSVVDKLILGLTGIFPDNNLQDYFQITVEIKF